MDTFEQWLPLRSLALSQFPKNGLFPDVYALRDIAKRDVLKYGCTGCLRQRIFGNYLGGVGGQTTQRIHAELFVNGMIDRVDIAWIETPDQAEAKRMEGELRRAYTKSHGQRPIWDLLD